MRNKKEKKYMRFDLKSSENGKLIDNWEINFTRKIAGSIIENYKANVKVYENWQKYYFF